MKQLFWACVLWLGCTLGAHAWQGQAEVLVYRVSFGPLSLGKAALAYTPGKFENYAVEARVKDTSALMDIDDVWRTEGVFRDGRWQPRFHHIQQQENDYRADKVITFKGNTAVYQNRLGNEPDLKIALPDGARDALSTLYDLRAQGVAALAQTRTLPVMGVKKAFNLEVKPAVGEKMVKGLPTVWRVDMYAHNPEKKRMDRWRVWLKNDAKLTPVRIEARVKIGTLTAVLDEGKK
ncbi:MAG: DUF3108 domain-containing protein [Alphaproteobacteria bacterium]